jgi:hypothetical protein
MKRFARAFAVTLGLVILGSAVSLVPQRSASGTGSAPVTVMNTTPIPVTGNVTAAVSGTVGAQQNGNWNVGITGTPYVNIANTPTVNFAAGSGLTVSNPMDIQNNPTPLTILDAPQPYEDTCRSPLSGQNAIGCTWKTIPAGKRLVIQEIDVGFGVDPGIRPTIIKVNGDISETPPDHFFTATFMGTDIFGLDNFATHQETRLYVGQNQTPFCRVELSRSQSSGNPNAAFNCGLSGFLLDVP